MFTKAVLIKRKSLDRLIEVEDYVPIGKEYLVDPESIRCVDLMNLEFRKVHQKDMILCNNGKLLPVELLKIGDS